MIKILVNGNRAEVGSQIHCMDTYLCSNCKNPDCKLFNVKYREPNTWMYNTTMVRQCFIDQNKADFPDVEPYLLDVSGPPKMVMINIDYKEDPKNSMTYDWELGPNSKISHYIHSAFNYEQGDVYGWPMDNMHPEDVDLWYHNGQRTFVFLGSHRGETVVTVSVVDKEAHSALRKKEWEDHSRNEINRKKAEALDDLLECELTWHDVSASDYKTELDLVRQQLKRSL